MEKFVLKMDQVKSSFYSARSPVNFASKKRLKDKFESTGVSNDDLFQFLLGQRSHTAFKPMRKKHFLRRSVQYRAPFETMATDLGDFSAFKKFNNSKAWLFLSIDIFSKYIYLEPSVTKGKSDMLECFEKLIESVPPAFKIHHIWSDEGECHDFVCMHVCACMCGHVSFACDMLNSLSLSLCRLRIHELQKGFGRKVSNFSLLNSDRIEKCHC